LTRKSFASTRATNRAVRVAGLCAIRRALIKGRGASKFQRDMR
jgi:hypothetical protein